MKGFSMLALAGAALSASAQTRVGSGNPLENLRAPWAMDHSDPARTGKTFYPGPSIGAVAWSHRVGGTTLGIACDRYGRSILGATFTSPSWSNELYVQTLNADGEIDWRVKVTPYPWGASQGVKSAPALSLSDEVVLNSGNGEMLKFDKNGDLVRTFPGTANATNDHAPATLRNGDIVHLEFLKLKRYRTDGTVVWSTGASSQTDPAVAVNGDVALGGVRTNEPHGSTDVSYFNADGTLRWSKTSTKGTRTQVCFGSDGTLYTTVGGTTAFNPDGSVKWNATNGGWGVCLDGRGRALVPQGNRVFAFDSATGALVWSVTLPFAGAVVEGLSIDVNDRIYATSTDGYFTCLRPDGTVAWNLKVCDQFATQPSISTQGTAVATGRVGFDVLSIYKIK